MAKLTILGLEKVVGELTREVKLLRTELAMARSESKAGYASALAVGQASHDRIDSAGRMFVALRKQVRA